MQSSFWCLIAAIQTPGAPPLRITDTGINAVALVSPSTQATFTLQKNTDMSTTNWVPVGVVPSDHGTNIVVLMSPAAGNRYFRLKWP